jgi:hypothetical protein
MEVSLNVNDRINLLSFLPQEGNRITLKIVDEIDKEINFTEEERKDYEIKLSEPDNTGAMFWTWNKQGNESVKNVNFTDSQVGEICKILKRLDSQEKLPKSMIKLYDIFIEK